MWKFFICFLAIKHTTHSSVRWQSWRLWNPPSIRPILCRTACCGGGWGRWACWWRRQRQERLVSSWRPAGNAAASSCLFSSLWHVCSGTRSSPERWHETAHQRDVANWYNNPKAINHVQHLVILTGDSLLFVASWELLLLLPSFPGTLC